MISLLQTIDQQNRSENAKISYTNTNLQQDLLQSMYHSLKLIESECNGQMSELNKSPSSIPSYPISDFDSNFYFIHLRSRFRKHTTSKLKRLVGESNNKIHTINRLISLAQEASIHEHHKSQIEMLNEVRDKGFKYHTDLIRLLSQIEQELNVFKIKLS